MKRHLLLTSILAAGYFTSTAQTPAIFKINPVGANTPIHQLGFRQEFKFLISNVNSFKLAGYTTAKPFNFEVSAPPLFSDVKIPEINKEGDKKPATGDDKSAVPQKKPAQPEPQPNLKKDSLSNDFLKNYNTFISNYQILQKMAVAEDSLYKMIPDIIVPDPEVLKDNATIYVDAIYKLNGTKSYIDEIGYVQKQVTDAYYSLKKTYEGLNAFAVSKSASMTGQLKTEDIVINMDNAAVTIKQKLQFEDEFKTATKIFNNLNDGSNANTLFNKAAEGIFLYNKIKASSFEIYTDAIPLNDDEIEVKPALKDQAGKVVKEFNPVTIKATGGLKVNFSTGYLLSFIGNENYTQGLVDGKAGLHKQEANALTSAIGALAHVYPRTAWGASIGISSGFSMTATGNIGFYLGGSGLFLEKNRLALTAGLSYIKIDKLNKANLTEVGKDGNTYTFNSNDVTPHYDSLYKPGFFFGITYNIFSGSDTKTAK